jgi:hypothetical protein
MFYKGYQEILWMCYGQRASIKHYKSPLPVTKTNIKNTKPCTLPTQPLAQ